MGPQYYILGPYLWRTKQCRGIRIRPEANSTQWLTAMGLLPDRENFGLRRECRERFPRHRVSSDPAIHHGTRVTNTPWCMPGSLTSVFLWSQWWGERSRHSWRMHKPQFYVSGMRPMYTCLLMSWELLSHHNIPNMIDGNCYPQSDTIIFAITWSLTQSPDIWAC